MIVGTAGHIDHGKTALVKALTGVDADRLKEEKARGITIDLGFAYADLGGGGITGFVDVPGHERLIHTMLAGANAIDFALLVVAADDGVMPQTREHLAILDLLGIARGVVALTKVDLAGEERRAALGEAVRAALRGTTLAAAPVLPVSALTGEGIADLAACLAEAERETSRRSGTGRLRMPVDRAFTLLGTGTVVTGTLISGQVSVGDQVVVSPAGIEARVRSINAQNRPVEQGIEGQRCALNLSGEAINRGAISRGDVVLDPGLHAPTDRIDAEIRLLASERAPLSRPVAAHLHAGAGATGARVVPLAGTIRPGESGLVQLVLDRPVPAAVMERFILRDISARRTLAGGRFLDLRAPARRRRGEERLLQLRAAGEADAGRALRAMLAAPPGFVDIAAFGRDRALAGAEVAEVAAGTVPIGGLVVTAGTREALRQGISELLEGFHAENPELQGMGRERLRLALSPRLPGDAFLALLKQEAEDEQVVLAGAFVRLPGHEVRLSAEDEATWAAMEPQLGDAARFRPPRVRDLAGSLGIDEREVRRVLKLCGRLGRVDEIAHDHFFLRSTTAEMVELAAAAGAETADGWFVAARFRDRMANGRKVAIQILDFFDRHRVTLRRGDLRRMNPSRLDLFAGTTAPE